MYHLVHANIAIMRAPWDDPRMAGFVAKIDEIDALAQGCPGYVAQPTPPDEGSVYTGRSMLNLSIWESVESLERFTYGGEHALMLERRAEWFHQQDGPNYVLFWFPEGQTPTEREVQHRMDHLAAAGATPYAFTFDQRFTVQEMLDYTEDAARVDSA
jgi:hypothetical protein